MPMFLALMKKELLALSRDVHGLGALFLMPMVFIVVMSMALKDIYSPAAKTFDYAIVNLDQGAESRKLVDKWAQENPGQQATPDHWERELHAARLKYVLKIDAGLSKVLSGEDKTNPAKAHLLTEPGLSAADFEALRMKLSAAVTEQRVRAAYAAERAKITGQIATPNPFNLPKREQATKDDKAFDLGQAPVQAQRISAGDQPSAVQQNVPAWLVFGMFFVVASIAGLFVEERACGALSRLRSMGVHPWQLVVSKIVPYLGVNAVQAALMLSVGIWLMPVIGGEGLSLKGVNWGALVLMIGCISFAAVTLALAVACLVSTHAQASAFGPILNVLMAALGGIMVPTTVMPSVMQKIATYSPMNWGLEGLLNVILRGADIASVEPMLIRLAGFGLLMLGVAFTLFRRKV